MYEPSCEAAEPLLSGMFQTSTADTPEVDSDLRDFCADFFLLPPRFPALVWVSGRAITSPADVPCSVAAVTGSCVRRVGGMISVTGDSWLCFSEV